MSIPVDQKVDLLYKQAFGVTKTDTEDNKSPSNESIPSPLLIRGDTMWTQADQIPGTASAVANLVQAYTGSNAVECTADNTTVPIGSVYPTWKTDLTYWIPAEFGATYQVQIWVDSSGVADPTATGTQIFAAGSGGTGEWYFNYQSGVLNFIGETIPTALTSGKVLYVVGYRYIGLTGVTNLPGNTNIGDLNFDGTTISSTTTDGNINLQPDGNGVVTSTANIVAPNFIGNISGNLTISAPNKAVIYSANGSAVGSNAFSWDYVSNILTLTGNVILDNADLGNLAIANYVNVANDTNVIGNVSAGNLVGPLANGNSNVLVYTDGNIGITATGNANVLLITDTGIVVTGTGNTIQSGAILANGTVTANGNIDGANANILGQTTTGNLVTDTITAPTGNLTISAVGTNEDIVLAPSGTGNVDVTNHRITSLATPTASTDAATKQYVDDIAQGLHVHAPCIVASTDTLATMSGGTVAYNNGTAGVGATLTISGSTITAIDGITLSSSDRILIKDESNQAHNGIYVYTSSTVLTRADDFDTPTEMAGGDFTFIQQGTLYNDTGWVMTDPVTTVGTDPVNWVQFSGAGTFTAGPGLTLNGTEFSVNVDEITTTITGGNVVVKSGAVFTTPNIGAATGTSLEVSGNLTANNLSVSNLANIDGNLTVAANIVASNNITANGTVFGNNANITNLLTVPTANITNVNVSTNIISNTITINTEASLNTANFSGNVIFSSGLVTFNNDVAGNTANFSGNVGAGGVLTDNLYYANGQPWDLQEAAGSNTEIQFNDNDDFGASANLTFDSATNNLSVSGNVVVATGAFYGDGGGLSNIQAANVVGLSLSGIANGTSNVNIPASDGNVTIGVSGNADIATFTGTGANIDGTLDVAGPFTLGPSQVTAIQGATVNTAATSQTAIASFAVSGISGVEFLVKGRDATSGNTSVATVLAVTDGSNVDYSIYGQAFLVGSTGSLAVNINGSNIELLATPTTTNSTQWVTQYRYI